MINTLLFVRSEEELRKGLEELKVNIRWMSYSPMGMENIILGYTNGL
ncbi:hypothetical protein [Bacteroides graminisolvens]|nr:hypothetical protein [Bacteroides graminisolvens]